MKPPVEFLDIFSNYLKNSELSESRLHYQYCFDNGLGGSVLWEKGETVGAEKGLWELAIIKWEDDGADYWPTFDYFLDDVAVNLSENKVLEFLKKISQIKVVNNDSAV